jgi:uncharacterized membrane protein
MGQDRLHAMGKFLGEDTVFVLLAAGFQIYLAVRAWRHGALEMLWTLLAWTGASFAAMFAFRHAPVLVAGYEGAELGPAKNLIVGVVAAVAAFAAVRYAIHWAVHKVFGPESHLGGWMYGGTGSVVSVLPGLVFLLLVALLLRATGTMFELESVDRISASRGVLDADNYPDTPPPTKWRNALEGLPQVAPVMDLFDPVATPARRNLAALLLASFNPSLRDRLRQSAVTGEVATHPVTVELVENAPDLAELIAGADGGFKYFRLLRHPKVEQALHDTSLRKSLEQVDVADEIKAILTGQSVPARKKWLERIFS